MKYFALLIPALAVLAACGGDDDEPTADGGTNAPCGQYLLEKTGEYEPGDRYIPGIVSVGLAKGMTRPEATQFLETLGTSWYLSAVYTESAVICVDEGREDEWIDIMKSHTDEVEWAHREGVRPLDAAPEEQ